MMCNCEIYDMNNIISTTATNTIFLSAIFSNLDYYYILLQRYDFLLFFSFKKPRIFPHHVVFFLMTTHFSVNKGGRKIGSNELLYFDITLLQENIIKIFLITRIRDLVQVIYRKF